MSMNIANVATITGSTIAYSSVPTSTTTILSTVTSGHVYKINSIIAANKTGTAATITVLYNKSATGYYLAYQMSVPANATLVVIGKDSPIYLNEADYVQVLASAANSLDVILSYDDIS